MWQVICVLRETRNTPTMSFFPFHACPVHIQVRLRKIHTFVYPLFIFRQLQSNSFVPQFEVLNTTLNSVQISNETVRAVDEGCNAVY